MVSLSKVFHALRPSHAPRPFRSLALQLPSPSAPPPISHVLIIIGNVRSTKISGPAVVIIIVIIIIVAASRSNSHLPVHRPPSRTC